MDEKTEYHIKLVRELDDLIAQGEWEGSLFYQAVGKKLRDFSEQLKKEYDIDIDTPEGKATPQEMLEIVKQKSGLVEIYISVYCTEGRHIKKWEQVLLSLPRQVATRPVYKREKDIRDTIFVKENPVNDAYVVAYVTEMDILKPSFREKALVDRFGHELLRLKDTALKPENMTKFIHSSGEYVYRKSLLSKI